MIFRIEGATFVPTDAARGPWDPNFLHGGPVAMLAAHAIEALPSENDLRVARLTLELVRPVPMAPLTVNAEITRPGRKVRLVAVSIAAEGREVTRATALQIRRTEIDVPANEPAPPPPGPSGLKRWGEGWAGEGAYYHSQGVELLPQPGADPKRPRTVWIRLRTEPVDSRPASPLQRILAAADFPNGVSLRADPRQFISINPELTVHVQREPAGEWVALDAETYLEKDGTGLAEGVLYDERGRLGRTTQSLIVEAR